MTELSKTELDALYEELSKTSTDHGPLMTRLSVTLARFALLLIFEMPKHGTFRHCVHFLLPTR